ncbi:TetR/AcrR family transcriptional regulator [Jatrophihabitans fulvus]
MPPSEPTSRFDRRKARTRAALVTAARTLMSGRDPSSVSIQEITETADVGFGSFYNHFESKDEVFGEAIAEVLDEHGAMLDRITAGLSDPAEVFAASVRITARFPKTHPDLAAVIARAGLDHLAGPRGLAPRALRDMERAKESGRFTYADPHIALACVGGSLLAVVQLHRTNRRGIDRASDELAANLLQMLGLPRTEAMAIARRELPRPPRRRTG